nr:hypothetical protein CFP56_02035 [Quercus suber]
MAERTLSFSHQSALYLLKELCLLEWRGLFNYYTNQSPLSTAVESIAGLISRKLSREFSEVIEGLVGIESPMLELNFCRIHCDIVGPWDGRLQGTS